MAAGVVSFIAHYLTLYSCYASIIAYLARFFCLSPASIPAGPPRNAKAAVIAAAFVKPVAAIVTTRMTPDKPCSSYFLDDFIHFTNLRCCFLSSTNQLPTRKTC
jgi:hypothetical protein